MDIAAILLELEAEREKLQDAIEGLSRMIRESPESGGPPPNPNLPPAMGGAAELAGVRSTRSRRETRREPS